MLLHARNKAQEEERELGGWMVPGAAHQNVPPQGHLACPTSYSSALNQLTPLLISSPHHDFAKPNQNQM